MMTRHAHCLCALALMPRLTRLSLGVWVAQPPPAGLVMACHGGSGATAGPQLTALELLQMSFRSRFDDSSTLQARMLLFAVIAWCRSLATGVACRWCHR